MVALLGGGGISMPRLGMLLLAWQAFLAATWSVVEVLRYPRVTVAAVSLWRTGQGGWLGSSPAPTRRPIRECGRFIFLPPRLGANLAMFPTVPKDLEVVIRVSVYAFTNRPIAPTRSTRILEISQEPKVRNVYTFSGLADMVNGHARLNGAMYVCPDDTVGKCNDPLAIFVPANLRVAMASHGVCADQAAAGRVEDAADTGTLRDSIGNEECGFGWIGG